MKRITLPLPPTINSYYSINRQGRRFKTKQAKDWEEEAGYLLLNHKKFKDKKIILNIYYFFKDCRSDLGNRSKILQDLLEKQGIVYDDNQVWERHEYKSIEKDNPRVEIVIFPYLS